MNKFMPFKNSSVKNVQIKKVELLNLCQELKSVLSNSVVDFKYIKYDFKNCRIHIISKSTGLFENSTVNYILTLWL